MAEEKAKNRLDDRPGLPSRVEAGVRRDGLCLFWLGAIAFLLVGFALGKAVAVSTADFRVVYFAARCLIEHGDPYQETQLADTYIKGQGTTPKDSQITRSTEYRYNYLPTAFIVTLPFAVLPFHIAQALWLIVTASSLIFASFLVWDVAALYAPVLSGALIGLTLANSELILMLGNPAGIAVSLCIIGVWCLVVRRYQFVGILCFAISLMLKPHVAGLVWLYFLMSDRNSRNKALQILMTVAMLSVPIAILMGTRAPHWFSEWRSVMAAFSSRGDINDPGPSSMAAHGIGMMINLQTVFSLIKNEPSFYDSASYVLGLLLLCPLLYLTARKKASEELCWFALSAYASISMLPVYHRVYDARILILAVPMTAILWKRRSQYSKISVFIGATTIVLTGAIPWGIFLRISSGLHPSTNFSKSIAVISQVAPVPVILLISSVFYLRAYWVEAQAENPSISTG